MSGWLAREVARRAAQTAWSAAQPHLRSRLGTVLPQQRDRETDRLRRAHEAAQRRHEAAVAKRDRVLQRSRRALPAGLAVAGGSTAASLLLFAPDGTPLLWGLAAAGGARAVVAARRLVRPPHVPPAPRLEELPAPAPHPTSAAAPLVRRLDQAHGALRSLLPLVTPAGRPAAEEAWHAAAEADTALRWQAARLSAAEPYRGVEGDALTRLEDGVAAQERLVQAVADLVAACGDPASAERLQDVTDRLHGLAEGLRAVR